MVNNKNLLHVHKWQCKDQIKGSEMVLEYTEVLMDVCFAQRES